MERIVDRDMFESAGVVAERVIRGIERDWDGQPIAEPGIYRKVPMADYHGQLTVGPSISSSGLRTIENKSPLHYWATSYLNENRIEDDDENEAFILGRAAHTLLLSEDGFRDDYVVRPEKYEDDAGKWKPWSGNANVCKEWLDARKQEGKTVLLKSQVDAIKGMAENLSKDPIAADLLRGRIERSIVTLDRQTGVWVKSRPDSIPADGIIADLKTCADASQRGVSRAIIDSGYLMQMALAITSLEEAGQKQINEAVLLFVEKKPPYAFNIKPLDNGDLYTAMRQNRRALNTFAECLKSGDWPSYPDSTFTWSAPKWWNDRYDNDPTLPELKKDKAA
jgi:hypothetical protein